MLCGRLCTCVKKLLLRDIETAVSQTHHLLINRPTDHYTTTPSWQTFSACLSTPCQLPSLNVSLSCRIVEQRTEPCTARRRIDSPTQQKAWVFCLSLADLPLYWIDLSQQAAVAAATTCYLLRGPLARRWLVSSAVVWRRHHGHLPHCDPPRLDW